MAYRNEGEARLIRQGSQRAIALAMEGRWREAVEANKGIIENFPSDVDAYNRLGRAYMELGKYSEAREAYGRTKELDPYNTIAEKNLRRLSHLGEAVAEEDTFHKVEPQHFIEEIGKTGLVSLSRLAPEGTLAKIVAGDKVGLQIDGASLVATNSRGEYLGQVEPKHAQRLIRLIKGGNEYAVTVVSSSENSMVVIIREVYQHPSQSGQPSFPGRGYGTPGTYTGDRLLGQRLKYDEAAVEPGATLVGENDTEALNGGAEEDAPNDSDEDGEQET